MYPFGKGQARYIWNLISAMGIFFMGFGVTVYHGISSLLSADYGAPIGTPMTSILILGFSLLVESYSLYVAFHSVNEARGDTPFWEHLRQGDDPTGVAVLLEDSIAVFGVALALAGIALSRKLQSPAPDAIASIFIGFLLGGMAVVLAIANGRILMGASAGGDWDADILEFIESFPTVERVVSLKTAVLAPGRLRASIEVEFHGGILVNRQQIERDADSIRDGDDPVPILVETAERMVRTVGREINRLEAEIHRRFPEIVVIDLEVN
jgi:zinc transporter 9